MIERDGDAVQHMGQHIQLTVELIGVMDAIGRLTCESQVAAARKHVVLIERQLLCWRTLSRVLHAVERIVLVGDVVTVRPSGLSSVSSLIELVVHPASFPGDEVLFVEEPSRTVIVIYGAMCRYGCA